MFSAFPKIFAIGSPQIYNLLDDEVEITEKIDGSQFGFGCINGEIIMRSKGAQVFQHSNNKLFDAGADYVCNELYSKLAECYPNCVFYGEILHKPKHSTLTYNRIPKNHIMLFGAVKADGEFVDRHDLLKVVADDLGLEVVPLIYQGKISHMDEIQALLDRESVLGGPKIEGIVAKRYQAMEWRGMFLPVMAGKFVSEAFKEVNKKSWVGDNTAKGGFEGLKQEFRTEARWTKAIQHLKEAGELAHEPKDIGKLIGEINRDIIEEEKEYIKGRLWNLFHKDILRVATAGFPQWYKEKLIKDFLDSKEEYVDE